MKIDELTEKIYQEGIEKAQKHEQEVLENARGEADRILAEARREAAEVAEAARKEAAQSKEMLARELKLAGDLALGQIKKRIADCLVDAVLPEGVTAAMHDPRFMQKLILEVVERWDREGTNVDVEVVLPSDAQQEMVTQFASRAKSLLDRGLEISYSEDLRSGFRIQPKDGSYRISFDEENFVAFFREFLRERTRNMLFPQNETTTEEPTRKERGAES